MKKLPDWLISYLRQPFVFIVWVMETYTKNTTRARIFMAKPNVAKTFKLAITFTMLTWIVVGIMASDEDRGRLTEKIRTTWGDIQDINEQKKLQNN
ncbi:MAG: hypothetical protein OEX17_03675 [Rhodospirillaceae bacterium]|nr:hypothetical protein [Rhodospirillaceae bacterium]